MLSESRVHANVPAADLARARRFYSEVLGLEPAQEVGPSLVYTTSGGTSFLLYETEFAGLAGHTIAQWHVDDIEAEVAALSSRGVAFEQYDMPGVSWSGGIATMPGMGRAAWFKDSEGNIMCLDQVEPGLLQG
ncbi:putative enzyme related to lactoylglutathione lyase [Motilibacter peucedani]|uniref:Putative enzyme related to lactoylglutathione lyase n=1 Tax=Motilibacter peucedani TaxID=598650 RepID=A0A420XKW2_9ACTN|nr:VOC family protein [Motilibacter peucedani]RKS69294.1 putative enzyme related to lactoylglutathione lyase [Motilibacter peucedani]